jgi:hypothetical protein
MVDDWELPQPEDHSEEDGALLFRNQIIPAVHGLDDAIQIQIDAFSQLFYSLVTALVILEFSPKYTLQRDAKPISYFNH